MSYSFLNFALLALLLFGCGSAEFANRRNSRGDFQGSDDALVDNTLRQFRVFDSTYDYNPKDTLTAADLSARFPVELNGTSQVAYLNTGLDFYAARMQLLDQATKSVRIQSLIFRADEAGYEITNKLIDLAKKGINVRVIVDPVTNYRLGDQKMFFHLSRHGIAVEGYELLYHNILNFTSGASDFGLVLSKANMRFHEKLFVIDGEDPINAKAIIGGANIANEYFRINTDEPELMWYDRDVVVKGEVATNISQTFDRNEAEFRNERLQMADGEFIWSIINAAFGEPKELELKLSPEYLNRMRAAASTPVILDWQPADIRFLQSRPRHQEDLVFPVYIDMINSADSEVLIANAYFISDPELEAAMSAALTRGANIKILTNGPKSIDFPHLAKLARTKYRKILASDDNGALGHIAIYEWAGDRVLGNGEGQNHSKYMVVDNRAVVVGSYNLDPRSRKLNTESVVVFENPSEAIKYADEFNDGISAKFSIEVTEQEAAKFEDPEKLQDKFEIELLKILSPLF